ncbi:MAG: Hsp70 family protein [Victivallales bacterium]|nr:Hsp70 family protein [Victivallales bacterium]
MNYLVGIDLGTTNTVVYYKENGVSGAKTELFNIPQLIAPGELKSLPALPSFVYLPAEGDVKAGDMDLPWRQGIDYTVGAYARDCAATQPDKVIISTKSWLCADNIDRRAALLPPHSTDVSRKLSALEATVRILEHVRCAWDYVMAVDDPDKVLARQQVVLTVPASFDAVARELTVEAARAAGLNIVLQEEPLAAFYSWLDEHESNWRKKLSPGDVVLVCDVGGGTSDFSLIKASGRDGNLELERIAVGRHILLGGDNMDLAAAYTAAAKLRADKNINLDNYQIMGLTQACRDAKEIMLSDPYAPPRHLTVLGRGSSVIGGTVTVMITNNELRKVVLDGFFPKCALTDLPQQSSRSGLRTFGLKYESDPAITRHLAEFMSRHCLESSDMPRFILFNGGVTKAAAIRERLLDTVNSWLGEGAKLSVLEGNDPDLAVGRGACCYAGVRQGGGVRIKAGSSHSYYIGVESTMPAIPGFAPPVQALCVVPFGMEEGSGNDIDYDGLGLIVGESASFRFFSSTERPEDDFGSVIVDADNSDALTEIPALTAFLPHEESVPPGSMIPVTLRSELTETGTVQLWCVSAADPESCWKLEFELRSKTGESDVS